MNKYFILPMTILALALSSCGALFNTPLPTPLPPEMIGTAVVQTQTAIAEDTARYAPSPTQTFWPSRTPRPTETPRPTWTASITPSPTVTFIITIPAIIIRDPNATPTGSITYPWRPLPGYQAANGCDLVALAPDWGREFDKGEDFAASWTFANYGPYTWNKDETDFKYIDGEKMFIPPTILVYDLFKTVLPGERLTITIPMKAPSSTGSFMTSWRLYEGDRFYCQVSIMIRVK